MRVVLVHEARLPVVGYGGTERVVWWLAKGLHQLGCQVVLACGRGSSCSFAEVIHPDFSRSIESQVLNADLFHYFMTPKQVPLRPHVVTIGGNGKFDEQFLPNTIFVSRNHALRHGATTFVYNGLDPGDYFYSKEKSTYFIFLAKASWRVKNVRGAIRLARRGGVPLTIVGGRGQGPIKQWRGISWAGMLGGTDKAHLLARSKALLFPVLWNEPFGLAVVEAMVSGTPVIASRRGGLPELIGEETGFLCDTEEEFLSAMQKVGGFNPSRCREWALDNFHYEKMAANYLVLYEKVMDGAELNATPPRVSKPSPKLLPIPSTKNLRLELV